MSPAALRLALLALAFLAVSEAAAEKAVPFLTGHVNDLAGMLPAAARDRVEQKLRDLEARSGAQVAVLTVDSLDGEALEAYSVRVAQTWRLGRKGVDDGALLLIAKQERRMRIEVGYGLEARLTDARARLILDDVVRPHFRQGDFAAGVEAGVDAIAATIEGKPVATPPAPERRATAGFGLLGLVLFLGLFTVVVGLFSLVALVTPGFAGWFLYLFLIPFYATFPTVAFPPYGGVFACGAWIVAFPVVRRWLDPTAKDFSKRYPGLAGMVAGGGHSGSGGGWSGGGGGFSGGGGSFGGGGASSSW